MHKRGFVHIRHVLNSYVLHARIQRASSRSEVQLFKVCKGHHRPAGETPNGVSLASQ